MSSFRIGAWRVEPQLDMISGDGKVIRLEPKVMQVLVCLAEHFPGVVSKDQLLQSVWSDAFVSDDVLTRCIAELRKALGDDARQQRIIETIPKKGYRLVCRPEVGAAPGPVSLPRRTARRGLWRMLGALAFLSLVSIVLAVYLRRGVPPPAAIITTVAGNGVGAFGGDGGPATRAGLKTPAGLAFDRGGNLFIADLYNHRIRRVDAKTGIITTVAGNGLGAFGGDGGPATAAGLGAPMNVAVDRDANLFIVDLDNLRIRRVEAATGIITTVAGNGVWGFGGDGGPATAASLAQPNAVTLDRSGNLFIADCRNNRIRLVDAATGIITTVAGNGAFGYSGDAGPATAASLTCSFGLRLDPSGSLFFSDQHNHRVRRLTFSLPATRP